MSDQTIHRDLGGDEILFALRDLYPPEHSWCRRHDRRRCRSPRIAITYCCTQARVNASNRAELLRKN